MSERTGNHWVLLDLTRFLLPHRLYADCVRSTWVLLLVIALYVRRTSKSCCDSLTRFFLFTSLTSCTMSTLWQLSVFIFALVANATKNTVFVPTTYGIVIRPWVFSSTELTTFCRKYIEIVLSILKLVCNNSPLFPVTRFSHNFVAPITFSVHHRSSCILLCAAFAYIFHLPHTFL